MVTEGIERFKKIVSFLGLYVSDHDRTIMDDPEQNESAEIKAFVNEDSFNRNEGFLICINDGTVYMCLETVEDLKDSLGTKEFVFNGAVPAWTMTDEMLIEHLGSLCNAYKRHENKKRLKAIDDMF